MLASKLMRRNVVVIREDLPLADLCDLFQHEHVHGVPVVDAEGRLLGFVSVEDVVYGSMGVEGDFRVTGSRGRGAGGKSGRSKRSTPTVKDIMTSPAVSVPEEAEVAEVCRIMWHLRIHHVPIVKDGRVTGIISSIDICRAIADGEM